jgi:hypothetical protein
VRVLSAKHGVSELIRQILGAASEFDKALAIAKLKDARDRLLAKAGEANSR